MTENNPTLTNEKWYDLWQVAELWHCSKKTVRKLILQRRLEATIIGNCYRVSESAIQDYYKRNTIRVQE